MRNDRPLDNPHIQEALDAFHLLCERYDLAGAVMFIDADEHGWAYHLPATWNAVIPDADLPLGFRIRVKEEELGRERAAQLMTGAAGVLTALHDFGTQTRLWSQDLLTMLRKTGMKVTWKPFGGQRLPRLTSQPPRR